jgi:glyoxylase-like metal-dependent hydrolase (beta-lactamase superfamily II)
LTILIETGVGPDVDRRFSDFYSLERPHGLFSALKELGHNPEDIDIVLNSHLHFDHCGGNSVQVGEKDWKPAYPKARYVVQKGEWEQALNPVGRDKPSYIPARLLCLESHGLLDLVEGDVEIEKGIRVVLTPGHTAFHQGVEISSGSASFFYFGDTIPTAAHVDLPYIMSFDLYPVETFETKKRLYEMAVEREWIVSFSHDPGQAFSRLRKIERKYLSFPVSE